ncbi:hypothetical protein KXV30_008983, partial [Aspergillus fumigatus]
MPASVEADGHVRVAASVPVDGARLSGADKGARAPANWSPLAPPVSVWVSLDPVSVPGARRPTGHPRCLRVCRSASVCPWRAPLPAGGRPAQGAPANWSPCRPPARRPPPRPRRRRRAGRARRGGGGGAGALARARRPVGWPSGRGGGRRAGGRQGD